MSASDALGEQFITLYHGTTASRARHIAREGFKPSGQWEDSVFFSTDRSWAAQHGEGTVIEVRLPRSSVMPRSPRSNTFIHAGHVDPKHIVSIGRARA